MCVCVIIIHMYIYVCVCVYVYVCVCVYLSIYIYACDIVWYDMMWYDTIWYDMIWFDAILYGMIWYDMHRFWSLASHDAQPQEEFPHTQLGACRKFRQPRPVRRVRQPPSSIAWANVGPPGGIALSTPRWWAQRIWSQNGMEPMKLLKNAEIYDLCCGGKGGLSAPCKTSPSKHPFISDPSSGKRHPGQPGMHSGHVFTIHLEHCPSHFELVQERSPFICDVGGVWGVLHRSVTIISCGAIWIFRCRL